MGGGKFVEWTGQWGKFLGLLQDLVCTCVEDLGLVRNGFKANTLIPWLPGQYCSSMLNIGLFLICFCYRGVGGRLKQSFVSPTFEREVQMPHCLDSYASGFMSSVLSTIHFVSVHLVIVFPTSKFFQPIQHIFPVTITSS